MAASFFRYLGLLSCGVLLTQGAWAQAPLRSAVPTAIPPSEEQSYSKEFVFGVNFNTQGGLLGGVSIRSARVLDDEWLRFWSLEGVMLKNAKEEKVNTSVGGSFVLRKSNYAFALRPSFGIERVLFRKAADAGVQVNGLLSAGPSLGLLMPYYIVYDRTTALAGGQPNTQKDDIVIEAYDPGKHISLDAILDHGPLFSGIGQTQFVPGVHLRGGFSFEYGRYRDAVTGIEAGFLLEAYTKRLYMLSPTQSDQDPLNKQFLPSVYLTLYFGHRS